MNHRQRVLAALQHETPDRCPLQVSFTPEFADDQHVLSYRGPDPHRPELYQDAECAIRDFKDEYWIVGVTVTTIFEYA